MAEIVRIPFHGGEFGVSANKAQQRPDQLCLNLWFSDGSGDVYILERANALRLADEIREKAK